MDPIKIEKAMSKYNKNQFLSTFILYSLTAFTCTLFCSSPLWFPTLSSSMKSFLFISLPKLKSFLFNPKCLFVVCNIIIAFLVGESKLGSSPSPATDIYDEYMKRSQSLPRQVSSHEEKKEAMKLEVPLIEETPKSDMYVHEDEEERREEGEEDEKSERENSFDGEEKEEEDEKSERENSFDGEEEPGLPADELKQRVEDFIARVNRQRMLEAEN